VRLDLEDLLSRWLQGAISALTAAVKIGHLISATFHDTGLNLHLGLSMVYFEPESTEDCLKMTWNWIANKKHTRPPVPSAQLAVQAARQLCRYCNRLIVLSAVQNHK
jgi:hypothetical protein